MKQLLMLLAAAGVAVGLTAIPAHAEKAGKQPGSLYVFDDGKLFSAGGVDAAKAAFKGTQFDHGLTMTVDTYAKLPDDKQARYKKENEKKFFRDWAGELAAGDKAKGIYVLICRSPGYVEVIADKETRDRGFTHADEDRLAEGLLKAFREARGKGDETAEHDKALRQAVERVADKLKDTTVKGGHGTEKVSTERRGGGMGIGGWVCLALCVGLGAWLVIGLIRALTGGGGGYGPGGYGGGGGGGFMTSLMGGLFGSMAGMWMYNNFFGGGGGLFGGGGSDAYAGDSYGTSGGGDTGAGDFSGDAGAGGSFDDGGSAGGGGDWGGGGDFGGGGGDFGGGDF